MHDTIYTAQDRTPYTYLIGWSELDMWYYGVRYSKYCHPTDLWVKYFTSSKYVKLFRELHGEPDIIQIRKTFKIPEKACLWEDRVMIKMKLVGSNRWLNRNNSSYLYVNSKLIEKAAATRRKRVYKKQVPWNKGLRKETNERLMLVSEKTKGREFSENHRNNMRKKKNDSSKIGIYHRTEEIKEKIRQSVLAVPPHQKLKCKYCGKMKNEGKFHLKHESGCIMNPLNAKFCAICTTPLTYRGPETCSYSCSNKFRYIKKKIT